MKKTGRLVVSIIAGVLFGACAFFLRELLFGVVKGTYEEVVDKLTFAVSPVTRLTSIWWADAIKSLQYL